MNVFNQSLWGDEGFSAILSMKPFSEMIKIVANDTSPPLWNISEWTAFKLFGTGEVVIRALAFFYFLIAVFFTYKIGSLLWNKKTGYLSAVLTFLNPFFFIYAFEGRMYSIMAAGVTASMYFFLRILKKKGNERKNIIGYTISTLWALYSHHFAIFALFVQGLWFLYEFVFDRKKKVAGTLFKSFIFTAVGYTPWLYPLYNQATKVAGGFWLGTPTVKDLFTLLGDYLGNGIKHPLSPFALGTMLLILLLRKWNKKAKESLFLLSWFLIPILATWGVSQVFQSIFFNRYLLYAIPGAMILAASSKRKVSNYLIAVVILLFAIIDFNYFTNPAKIPFQDLSTYVLEQKRGDDFVINEDAGSHKLWEAKYYGIPAPVYTPENTELPFFVGTALFEEGDIVSTFPKGTNRLGVITFKEGAELTIPGFLTTEEKRFGELNFVWMIKN